MKLSVVHSSLVAVLACSLFACSSKDDSSSTGDGVGDEGPGNDDGKTGNPSCDPNGEIPCYEGLAEPCRDLNSGFLGDEFCLAPPDPELGLQVHVGPKDYDDPEQTDKYMIYPGEETNWAEVTTSPNDEVRYTRGYHSHMRPGSHHFIMYGLNVNQDASGPMTNGSGAESAVGALNGVFLGGATRAIQNIDTRTKFPEDQGIGSEMTPHRSVAMNMHFINTGNEPLLQELWVNFILIDESEVTQYVKPVTWYGGFGMNIPPGAHQTLRNADNSCKAPPEIGRIGMLTGHVHANTVRITSTETVPGADPMILFEDYDWHEPTEWRFNQAVVNEPPDAATKQGGAYNGVLRPTPGGYFNWECEVQNQSSVNLKFSNKVYDGEMCNVFGFYFTETKDAAPWTCIGL